MYVDEVRTCDSDSWLNVWYVLYAPAVFWFTAARPFRRLDETGGKGGSYAFETFGRLIAEEIGGGGGGAKDGMGRGSSVERPCET